jgi:hypothetical protein
LILSRGVIVAAVNFHLRGLSSIAMERLKRKAKEQDVSVNALVIEFIERGAGCGGQKIEKVLHHELDALSGTWSPSDLDEFQKNTAYFESIDKDMWI